ncbi:MAG: peptide deformylase [Deltaproteobacteria bacterium]|nr:peptide deformylase [Deltaproteobacteria bacterium]
MAVRKVLIYPAPLLRKISKDVLPDDPVILSEIEDLTDTLNANPGVAIAAPQIGVLKRIIAVNVVEEKQGQGPFTLINPVIKEASRKKMVREGCLSIPEYTGNLRRFKKITVSGLNKDMEAMTITSVGLEAIAIQHEIDHLDGILFIDRIESARGLFRRKYQ